LEASGRLEEALAAQKLLFRNRKEEPQGLRDCALLEAKLGKIEEALVHLNQVWEGGGRRKEK
jgi:hypothetical protein